MLKLTRLITSFLLVTAIPLAVGKSHSLTVSPRINSPSSLLSGERLIAQRQKRVALVIGNGAYPEDPLANPVNDATDVAKALTEIGFEVTLLENANKRGIDEAVEAFNKQLRQGEIGIFYYAGHGVQVAGENYVIPIDAKLAREADVGYEAIPLGKIINAIEDTDASVKIIILDACRDNPFYRRWRSTGRGLASRGLAGINSSGKGTLIAFSTAPGQVAADSLETNGGNSPYTAQLLKYLKAPNLEIGQMFRKVRSDVLQATNDRQVPWVSEALVGDVYLNRQGTGSIDTPPPVDVSSISVNNIASYRGVNGNGANIWDWTVFIQGPAQALEEIQCVKYNLHPTFTPSVIDVCERGSNNYPFALKSSGWGTFEIQIQISFRDGSRRSLSHELRF